MNCDQDSLSPYIKAYMKSRSRIGQIGETWPSPRRTPAERKARADFDLEARVSNAACGNPDFKESLIAKAEFQTFGPKRQV